MVQSGKCLFRCCSCVAVVAVLYYTVFKVWTGVYGTTARSKKITAQSQYYNQDGGGVCPEIGTVLDHEHLSEWVNFVKALEDYKVFHKQQIGLLKMGNDTVRTLTFFCPEPCSGVADQLYGAEYFLLLAIVSRRVLSVVWNDHHNKTMKYLHPNKINWEYFNTEVGMHTEITTKIASGNSLAGEYEMGKLARLIYSPTVHVTLNLEIPLPFQSGYHEMILDPTISSKFYQIGLGGLFNKVTQSELLPFLCGKILRYLFTFSSEIVSAVDSFQESLGIRGQHYVGVHVRTGFMGSKQQESVANIHEDSKIFRKKSDWLKTFTCSVNLADQFLGPSGSVYLASDSEEVKRLATEQFPSRIKSAHFTLQHIAGDQVVSCQNCLDGYMSVWVDFLLLARSHVLVRFESGFPTVAGQFCSIGKQYCGPVCLKLVEKTATCWQHYSV